LHGSEFEFSQTYTWTVAGGNFFDEREGIEGEWEGITNVMIAFVQDMT